MVALVLASLLLTPQRGVALANPGPEVARHGINLNGPVDWNTELPFVDVFRMSREWVSQREGASWGQGPALDLDANGWVKSLQAGCYAESPLCTIEGGRYPSGVYTVLYQGKGKLEFWGAASIRSQTPGRIEIDVDSSKGGFFLRLRETDPADYIRNIRVVMPGFERTYQQDPFHPAFFNRWKGQSSLRFMDWMHTNNSTIETWAQRPTPQSASYSPKGVSVETMVDLANRLKADPWFCIPHRANDDYVTKFAQLVKKSLDPSLRVYVEYSNEVWNGQFQQHLYAGQKGIDLGFSQQVWSGAWHYTAYRSKQIFAIWQQVFGDTKRLVRVLPSQAGNVYVAEQILKFQDAYKSADALAIAPYFGLNVGPTTNPNEATVQGWTVDQALAHLRSVSLPESLGWVQQHKNVANQYGLKLIAYEGGQHMVGIQGGENNNAITSLFHAANAHPEMGAIYTDFLNGWKAAGGGLFANFSSVGGWSKWGSWGLNQYYNDPNTPKMSSSLAWARAQGQLIGGPKTRG